jgi:hypothetical protein
MATPSSTLPPTGMWDLLIRNVTRDASPLSSAELELLRQTRQELGPERWKQLLDVARTESRRRRREGHKLFLPTPGDKPWSPTTIPPPRTNNIKPAFGLAFGEAKSPPRRSPTMTARPAVVVREASPSKPDAAARAGAAAARAPPTSPAAVAAASARKRQLADARAVAACASAARKRAIADARESRRALQALEATLDKRDAELKEARATAAKAMAERDALREKLRAASLKDSIKEHAGVSLRRLDSARGAALLAAAVVVDSANEEGCPAAAKLALAAAEDHLRAFASAALAVAEKFGSAAPPTRAVSSGGATDAAADAQHYAALAEHLDRESAAVPGAAAAPTALPSREGPKGAWR